jgi:hypothetical protein
MTKEEALYKFFSGFGMDAYPSSVIPDEKEVEFPYISYENAIGFAGDPTIFVTAQIWFRTESEAVPNAVVSRISEYIGRGGVIVPYDEGTIWIKRGTPWCNSLADDGDPSIKRRILNLEIDFM